MFSSEDKRMESAENLAIEGVATKAVAYTSALVALDKRFPSFVKKLKRAGGDSSGSLTSMLVCLGYTPEQIENIAKTEAYQNLLPAEGILKDTKRLLENYGIFDNLDLLQQIEKFIKDRTGTKEKPGNANLTFGELHALAEKGDGFKDLYVIVTHLTLINKKPKLIPKIFCYQNAQNTRIADAVLASSAIAFVYPAVRLQKIGDGHYIRNSEGHAYIDGGLIAQVVPVTLFDATTQLLRETDIVEGDPIPRCEPAKFAEYLLDAIRSQDLSEIKASSEFNFNQATVGLQIATPLAIKQLTDVSFKATFCPIRHPIQAIEEKLTQDVNNFVFGRRDEEIQKNNHGRITFIPTPKDISDLTFALDKLQIDSLIEVGTTTIQHDFPSKGEAFAAARVEIGKTFPEAKTVEKTKEAETKEEPCCVSNCVIL